MSTAKSCFSLGLAALALGCCFFASPTVAQDAAEKKADKPKAGASKAAAKSEGKADEKDNDEPAAKPKDRYLLPKGGVKELLAFIKDIREFQPTTQEEADQHNEKALGALKAAGEKVLKIAKDDDKKLPGFDEVSGLLLAIRAVQVADATPAEQKQLIEDIKARLTGKERPNPNDVGAAMQVASTLEDSNPKLAATAYREFGGVLAKSENEQAVKIGQKMEGAGRRLSLIGNQLEISGTLMDGKKFDWAKYRGKVVLVDFWATWCGPCRAELPNVKKYYKQYHDQGFDVVGISLDDDRAELEKLLADDNNPWPTLHDGGWDTNPVATYYGVMGIPTVILVDKEGKVVSTNARGEELGKLLASLLGPPKGK